MLRFSFVIPSYNGGDDIIKCVKSIFEVAYPEESYEIVVVDDGSTDNSISELRLFHKHKENLIIKTIDHKGASYARNIGVKESKYEIIVFLDQDVIVDKYILSNYRNSFREGAEVVQGDIWGQIIETPLTKLHKDWRKSVFLCKTQIDDAYLDTIVTRNVAVKRTVLLEVEEKTGYIFKSEDLSTGGEDRELGYRINSLNYKILLNSEASVKHNDPKTLREIMRQKYYHAQGDVRQGIGEHLFDVKNFFRAVLNPRIFGVPIWFSFLLWASHILGAVIQRLKLLTFYSLSKRLIDLVGSLIGIVLGFPLLFFIYILIIMDSEGPAVFKQIRLGRNNKLFEMYKFRTMVINAEEILKNDPELLKEYQSNSYKIKNDPRVTRVGNFLRKSSLDELPQLFNILKGEMSIVGPRAYKSDELITQLRKHPELRLLAGPVIKTKPGLTGLWQTSGRSNIGFEERIKLDNKYATTSNLFYDLWLILKTIPAVLKSRGAY